MSEWGVVIHEHEHGQLISGYTTKKINKSYCTLSTTVYMLFSDLTKGQTGAPFRAVPSIVTYSQHID